MTKLFFLFTIILALILEVTIMSMPLVLDVLLVFFILKRKSRLLVPAFFSGIALDIFRVRALGSTGIFFIVFILLVFLYEKKLETATYPFVFFSAFLGGMAYLIVFGYGYVLEQAAVGSIMAVLLFKLLSSIKNQKYFLLNLYI